ncbi:MAG TPA: T9SS type A sorting domain-containing protein, partial [Rhodothermales bacterium]|nr:T9SS type A sorting domain-containing protein [Rhodothermales bacterium]
EGTLLRLYRSSSETANWQAIDDFPPRDLAIGPQGHIFGLEYDVEENGNLWRSTDDGETWQHLATVPHARMLMIHPNGDIFLGTELNRYSTRGIYRSSDDGQTWVQLTNGLTSTRNPNGLPEITSLIVDDAGQIFAGTFGDGLFRSTNGGDTWQATRTEAEFIETMIVNGGKLFVSTRTQGIFATEDGGDTWVSVNDNLGNYGVPSLSVDDDGHLVAGTTGNGVFRTANPISVRVEDQPHDALADASKLQGYPNPFSTVTTLAFTLSAAMPVRLAVHDVMGREVAVLLDEHRAGGYQATTFQADGLPSGIYLVTLSTPQGDFHEKVLLVK